MATLYNLSSHYWGSDVISLKALEPSGDVFATLPLQFLQTNGTNTWRYIHQLAGMLVSSVPRSDARLLDLNGNEIDLSTVPSAGEYVYVFERKTIKTLWDHSLTHYR